MKEKSLILKQNYISLAYNILVTEGVEALTIRRLASELNCNSANLYRFFSGLDELVIYASIRFLKDYIREVSIIMEQVSDPLELHLTVWECFARFTFSEPEIFNNLFWKEYSCQLDSILKDYYTMNNEELVGIPQETAAMFMSGNFDYRDYIMLSHTVKAGLFSEAQAHFLNAATMNIYKGVFKELLDTPTGMRNTKKSLLSFMECLRTLFSSILELNELKKGLPEF